MPKKAENSFKMQYDPELDTSPELDPDAASYNLTDIITKVLSLSSHVALHREEHLEAAVHVMVHVGQRYNSSLVYDPSFLEIDHSVFKECDWLEFYRDAKAVPVNAPEP